MRLAPLFVLVGLSALIAFAPIVFAWIACVAFGACILLLVGRMLVLPK